MSTKVTRRALLAGAGAAAIGVAVAGCGGGGEPDLATRVVARRVTGPLPIDDPRASLWGEEEVSVAVIPQRLANPQLQAAAVESVRVSAAHDGTTLAYRVGFTADTPAEIDGLAEFHDAVALMLPAARRERLPITMGAPGKPVHLIQWRGSWEKDVQAGHRWGVDDIYAGTVRDLTPADILPPRVALLWEPARYVGNSIAVAHSDAVEEMVAEGFGTTTGVTGGATGTGVHDGDTWWVTLGVPMARKDVGLAITPGLIWPAAFAVWVGAAGNRGSRKQYSDWIETLVEA